MTAHTPTARRLAEEKYPGPETITWEGWDTGTPTVAGMRREGYASAMLGVLPIMEESTRLLTEILSLYRENGYQYQGEEEIAVHLERINTYLKP